MTTSVSTVDDTMPPIIGTAMRCITSAPVPWLHTLRLRRRKRIIEINQHHPAGFSRDTGQRDEADGDGDRKVEAEPPHQPQSAGERERDREHDDQGLGPPAEIQV